MNSLISYIIVDMNNRYKEIKWKFIKGRLSLLTYWSSFFSVTLKQLIITVTAACRGRPSCNATLEGWKSKSWEKKE
jgi:hypothetical protein